jgi:hypothetical protein
MVEALQAVIRHIRGDGLLLPPTVRRWIAMGPGGLTDEQLAESAAFLRANPNGFAIHVTFHTPIKEA